MKKLLVPPRHRPPPSQILRNRPSPSPKLRKSLSLSLCVEMADFGNLSDTDDSAVGELISQAQDLSVLEQEKRFSPLWMKTQVEKRVWRRNPKMNRFSPPSDSSNSWIENFISTPSKHNSGKRSSFNSKLKSESFNSPLGSPNYSMDSPSPPRKTGCFWCSPKKDSKKKKKENWNIIEWGSKNDEFLSVLNTFSSKEQEKILRQAMKEQEKISREAEKIVQWAKQASDRMSFHGIEDELSDDDDKSKI
ncbi:hypothetical protein GH714_025047 [Hevea brasiliensis]|uniref:Uncharacterized protein n=1 Tax=Hevea brasiliensis TaxID=3981 RepID=A0A6A6M7T3_HEVBR|nr:hypothetical protein GH714_025047 [Hevea brasiliensis]